MTEKIFCPNCNHSRQYTIEKRDVLSFRGVELKTFEYVAICENCKEDISVYELDDENLKRLYREYKIATSMVLPEEIVRFREIHNLSQKEFASIVGISECNIKKYENGSIQSRACDKMLRKMIGDEKDFANEALLAFKFQHIDSKTKDKALAIFNKIQDELYKKCEACTYGREECISGLKVKINRIGYGEIQAIVKCSRGIITDGTGGIDYWSTVAALERLRSMCSNFEKFTKKENQRKWIINEILDNAEYSGVFK